MVGIPTCGIHYLEIATTDAESARKFYEDAYGWVFSLAEPTLGYAFVAELPGGFCDAAFGLDIAGLR